MSETRAEPAEWSRPRRGHLYLLIPAVLFFFFVNLWGGSLKDFDEARYAGIAREMAESGRFHTLEWNYTFYFKKPPLAIWCTALLFKLFGAGEFTARLLSASCGAGTVILTYFLGCRLFGARAALIGALALVTSPLFLKYARLGMLDGPLTFLITLGIFVYWKARENRKLIPWLGLIFAAALLTKSAAGLLLPGIIGLHAIVAGERKVLWTREFWISHFLGGVIAVSWTILQVGLYGDHVFGRIFYHVVTRATEPIESHTSHLLYYPAKFFLMNTLMAVVAAIAVFRMVQRRLLRRSEPELLLLLAWAGTVFALFTVAQTKIVWYILPAVPPFALACGWLLDRSMSPRGMKAAVALSLLQIAAHMTLIPRVFTMDYSPEIKAMLPRMAEELASQDTIYLHYRPGNSFLFYSRKKIRRADDEIRARLFVESVRERGKRYCLSRVDKIGDLLRILPEPFQAKTVLERGEWAFVEVSAGPGPELTGRRDGRSPEPVEIGFR